MKPRLQLALYLAALLAASSIHEAPLLAVGLLLSLAATGRPRWQLLLASLRAMAFFSLTVGLSYLLLSAWQGQTDWRWLQLTGLRVLLMVYLGLWFVKSVSLLKLLAPWPTANLLATLTLSQIQTYRRLLADFRLAFISRHPAPPQLTDRVRHAGAQGIALLDKALVATSESALALKSRGVFDGNDGDG